MEVKNNTLKYEFELAEVLRLILIGFTKKQIRKKLDISKSNLSYYLDKLEKSGNIQRIGKYQIKVLSSSKIHPKVTVNQINKKLNKRGHAHNFKVIFPMEIKDLRLKPLIKQGLSSNKRFKTLNFGSLRFSYKRFTIWINKSTLTIYSSNSYYSDDALMSKFMALKDLDILIKYLKNKFNFKGIYGIEIFREHYGLIFNEFAKWLLEKGDKMEIKDKGNKSILWVDDSKEDDIGLKEFEGINPIEVNNADNLFKSHERTSWKVTPEFVLEGFNKMFAINNKLEQQISSHLKLIQEYRKENISWRKSQVKQIKQDLKERNQKQLSDY